MNELFPICAGAVAGVIVFRTCAGWARAAAWLLTCLVIAVIAGLVSGELARSAGFLLVDFPEALAVSACSGTVSVWVPAAWASR